MGRRSFFGNFLFILPVFLGLVVYGTSLYGDLVLKYDFTAGNLNNVSGSAIGAGTMNTGTPNFVSDPLWGQVLQLDGTQYLNSGANATALGINANKPKTTIVWVNMDAIGQNGSLFNVGGASGANQFGLRPLDRNNQWRLQYNGGDRDFYGPASATGNWVQLAVTYDEGVSRIYINGNEAVTYGRHLNVNDASNFTLGWSSYVTPLLNGKIANVEVYNEALSRNEILQRFAAADNSITQAEMARRSKGNIQLTFDGTLENFGTSNAVFSLNTGTANYVPAPELGGRDVLKLSGTQFLASDMNISDLGMTGTGTRTISVLAKVSAFNEGGLFDMGANQNRQNFSLRTETNPNMWRIQMWGTDATGVNIPNSQNQWALYTLTYTAGNTAQLYFNGVLLRTHYMNENDFNTAESKLRIGVWSGTPLQGEIAGFWADSYNHSAGQISNLYNEIARQYGGFAYSFDNAVGGSIGEAGWMMSCGTSAIRVGGFWSGNENEMALLSNGNNGTDINTKAGSTWDSFTGMTWGPVFTLLDENAAISLRVCAGGRELDLNSKINGGAGVALWDVAEGKIVESTFRTGNSTNANWLNQTIPLNSPGLEEGKQYMLVGIDREIRSYGWFGVDSIMAPIGSVMVADPNTTHKVTLEFTFDEPGNWAGWTQVGASGNPTSFVLGNTPSNALSFYIDSQNAGAGFLASTSPTDTDWNRPTGELISPTFIIDGDIIEFMIAGGSGDGLGFDLMVDMLGNGIFTSQKTSKNARDSHEFIYDYWNVQDFIGREAYFSLWDNVGNTWGYIVVDNIRMINFLGTMDSDVPEPGTWLMLLLGLGALGCRRMKRSVFPV